MSDSLAFLLSNTTFSLFTSQSHVSSFIKPKIIVKFNLIYSQNVSTCTCIVSRTKYMFVLICVTCIPHTTTLRKSQTIPTNIWSSVICNDENVASAVCISVGYCIVCVYVCYLLYQILDDVWYDINFESFNSCRWTFNSIGCKILRAPGKKEGFLLYFFK